MSNGHLKAFTADKGEPLLDVTLPVTAGTGPPMTYMFEGKQYIAVMGGTGASGFGFGGGGGGRGGRGPAPAEPTAAAAQGAAPAAVTNNNAKLMVYAVPN